MKPTFKDIATSGKWIVDKATQGCNNKVRIDAHTRFHEADGVNFYSEWLSLSYVNRIRRENGLCKIQESRVWHY